MPVVTRLIRNTPGPTLRDYFTARSIPLPAPVNWNGDNGTILRPLLQAVDALPESRREVVRNDAERVDIANGA